MESPWTASEQVNELNARLALIYRPDENVLAAAYLQLAHEGLLETVWHVSVPPLSKILEDAKRADTGFYACFKGEIDADKFDLVGLGWATDMTLVSAPSDMNQKLRATVGMSFFRAYQQRRLTREFCSMMLEHGFDKLGIEAAYGYAPVQNRAACLFHRGMNFEVLCIAPSYSTWAGKPCDVQISAMTKERWEQQSRSGQAENTWEEFFPNKATTNLGLTKVEV
jgi:RimJ/RimL family protein N-acetyltransferase